MADIGETRNKRKAHIVLLNVFKFRKDTCNEAAIFLRTHMKLHLGVYHESLYDILHVKNSYLKSVYHVKETSTCTLLTEKTGSVYCPVRSVKIQRRLTSVQSL
jgi:hypothetical protein